MSLFDELLLRDGTPGYSAATAANTTRYLRLHSYDVRLISATGTFSTAPFMNVDPSIAADGGSPWQWSTADSTTPASVRLAAGLKLPRGAKLDKIWGVGLSVGSDAVDAMALSMETPGAQSAQQIDSGIGHTSSAVALLGPLDISAFTDGQYAGGATDPTTSAEAMPTINAVYDWNYDATSGGSQTAKFYGFVVKYHYAATGSIVEPT